MRTPGDMPLLEAQMKNIFYNCVVLGRSILIAHLGSVKTKKAFDANPQLLVEALKLPTVNALTRIDLCRKQQGANQTHSNRSENTLFAKAQCRTTSSVHETRRPLDFSTRLPLLWVAEYESEKARFITTGTNHNRFHDFHEPIACGFPVAGNGCVGRRVIVSHRAIRNESVERS